MTKSAWVITDGSAGMENQAWGLAEALGYKVEIKRIQLRQPWLALAPFFRCFKGSCLSEKSDSLTPPYPDLVMACGRRSILPALWLKEQNPDRTKLVYLQDPKISSRHFDAVVCPLHDHYEGPNVIQMDGAPHRITAENLDKGIKEFTSLFASFTRPVVGVLIGGPNRTYSLDTTIAENLCDQLIALHTTQNIDLVVTPSRRTPDDVIDVFQKKLGAYRDHIYFWNREGSNPYFGILALSDALLFTCDSVSMASEAASTDKPCYFLSLPGGNKKFRFFQNRLIKAGRAQWFDGSIDFTPAKPWDDTEEVVEKLKPFLQ